MNPRQRWITAGIFAAAMGYLEAAVVFYLRTLVQRMQPHQTNPLPDFGGIVGPEMGREFATLVMVISAGWLAGQTWRGRIGYALLIFGIWDITYYIFLIPLTGWPKSLLDWDILFLIPLPWWGPVWSPISIALLMILFGLACTHKEHVNPALWPKTPAWGLCFAGILLALYVFMSDAIAAMPNGPEAVRAVLPDRFQWTLFLPAWLLMAAPVAEMVWRISTQPSQSPTPIEDSRRLP